jgi:sugar lactone lactonase YvrE
MMRFEASVVSADRAVLGEGPLWDAQLGCYWWIDIELKRLHCFRSGWQRSRAWQLDQIPGAVALRRRDGLEQGGGLVAALQQGFALFEPKVTADADCWNEPEARAETPSLEQDWQLTMLGSPEPTRPENRLNDGKVDSAGRFWAGTMRIDDHMNRFTGTLYSLEPNHSIRTHWGEGTIGVSNGMAWSSDDRKFFYVDSPRRVIYSFDYEQTSGSVSNCSVAFQVPEELGYPDGMAIDVEDKLWVALWGAGRVARVCPERGRILDEVTLPVSIPTACTFGGPGLDQLLITTASIELTPAQRAAEPLAGALFAANVGVRGFAPHEFAG